MMQIQFQEREEHRKKMGDQFQSQRTINNIVIFIEFADASFTKTDLTQYERDYNTGDLSMRAYFEEVSYSKLTVNSHFFPKSNDGKIKAFKSQRNREYLLPKTTSNLDGWESQSNWLSAITRNND